MPAKARNIGAERSSGSLLCFIDSDVYLATNWIEEMLAAYENGCQVASGAICLPEFQKNVLIAKAQFYLEFNEFLNAGNQRTEKLIPSCNMMCTRELFSSCGGFPELRASEDTSFCLSLPSTAKIQFLPQAKCYHIFRVHWKSFLKNQELIGEYVSIYHRAYYDSWFYKGLMPILFFPGFLAIKIVRICGRIGKSGRHHIGQFIISFPVFLVGLFFWSIGFLKGCRHDEPIKHIKHPT